MISDIDNYLKYNNYYHKLLILQYIQQKYYRNDKNIETNKNDFISFINKIVQYNNILININLFHHFHRILIISLNNEINTFLCISFIKMEHNVEIFHAWET